MHKNTHTITVIGTSHFYHEYNKQLWKTLMFTTHVNSCGNFYIPIFTIHVSSYCNLLSQLAVLYDTVCHTPCPACTVTATGEQQTRLALPAPSPRPLSSTRLALPAPSHALRTLSCCEHALQSLHNHVGE